jgi:hypothetical protein
MSLSGDIPRVAGGVKGNRICLSGGVLLVDAGTVGVEAENLFLLFITRPSGELRCYIINQESPCPLAILNPFGYELLLLDVPIGFKRST